MKHRLEIPILSLSLCLVGFSWLLFNPLSVSAQAFVRPCKAAPPTTLQTFTASNCSALAVGNTTVLTDTRNGQSYRVRKFADGHCWMIDNMKLAGVTLTPADSNVTSNVALPAAATSGSSNNTTIQIWDGSAQTYCATASNFAADSTTRCGYHYNWMAATAGTGTAAMTSADATASICPKGWKLPPNTGDGSFLNLANAAGFTNNAAGVTALQNDTTGFSARFSGLYNSGWYLMDSVDYYWSRSAYSSARAAYNLYFYASNVYPQNDGDKYYGVTVRCVL